MPGGSVQDVDRARQVVDLELDVFVTQAQFELTGDDVSLRDIALMQANEKIRETGMVWVDQDVLVVQLKPEPWVNGTRVYQVSGKARESERVKQLRMQAEMAAAAQENVRERTQLEVTRARDAVEAAEKHAAGRDDYWKRVVDGEIQKRADLVVAYDGHLERKSRSIRIFRNIAAVVTLIDIFEVLALAHLL